MSIHKTPSEWFPILLKRARERRDWTAEQLAEAVASHGGSLTANAIAKIETNRRNVSIDEWLILAAAVNVPPPLLLIPLGVDETVRITSRSEIHPAIAFDWITGDECLVNSDRYIIDRRAWLAGALPVFDFARLNRTQKDVELGRTNIRHAEYVGDEDLMVQARKWYADALRENHRAIEFLIRDGLRVPEIAVETIDDMRTIGLDVDHLPVYEES